jgi:hypothetical protein
LDQSVAIAAESMELESAWGGGEWLSVDFDVGEYEHEHEHVNEHEYGYDHVNVNANATANAEQCPSL